MDAQNAMRDGRKGDADGDIARLKEKDLGYFSRDAEMGGVGDERKTLERKRRMMNGCPFEEGEGPSNVTKCLCHVIYNSAFACALEANTPKGRERVT